VVPPAFEVTSAFAAFSYCKSQFFRCKAIADRNAFARLVTRPCNVHSSPVLGPRKDPEKQSNLHGIQKA
jgi:hypothetical protein